MSAIVGVDHGQGVAQPIGHLLDAQMQAAFLIGRDPAQVLGQLWIAQQVGIAVVCIVQLQVPTEAMPVGLQALQAGVVGEEGNDRAAPQPEAGAVVWAESRERAKRRAGVLRVKKVSSIRGTFLGAPNRIRECSCVPQTEEVQRKKGTYHYSHQFTFIV